MRKALTFIHLPVVEKDYSPGDPIEDDDWDAAGQTDEDHDKLVEAGAISLDPDAPAHPSHAPVVLGAPSFASMVENARILMEELGENAPPEVVALANADYRHVIADDTGNGASNVG